MFCAPEVVILIYMYICYRSRSCAWLLQSQQFQFNQEEFDLRMESLPWIITDSVNIDRYFTKVELENLCDYERLRLKNMKRNYETMQLLGQ